MSMVPSSAGHLGVSGPAGFSVRVRGGRNGFKDPKGGMVWENSTHTNVVTMTWTRIPVQPVDASISKLTSSFHFPGEKELLFGITRDLRRRLAPNSMRRGAGAPYTRNNARANAGKRFRTGTPVGSNSSLCVSLWQLNHILWEFESTNLDGTKWHPGMLSLHDLREQVAFKGITDTFSTGPDAEEAKMGKSVVNSKLRGVTGAFNIWGPRVAIGDSLWLRFQRVGKQVGGAPPAQLEMRWQLAPFSISMSDADGIKVPSLASTGSPMANHFIRVGYVERLRTLDMTFDDKLVRSMWDGKGTPLSRVANPKAPQTNPAQRLFNLSDMPQIMVDVDVGPH